MRTYRTEVEAEIARAALNAHGIAALVQRQDAAGLLRAVQGVQLIVRREDLEVAREVLDAGVDTSDSDTSDSDTSDSDTSDSGASST